MAAIFLPLAFLYLVAQVSAQLSISGSGVSQSISGSGSNSATPTASAQFPDLSGYSICATTCLTNAVAATGCSSIVDVNCYCTPKNVRTFTNEMVACISGLDNCSSDLNTAEDLARRFCAVSPQFSLSQSLSFPASATTTIIPVTPSASPSSSIPMTGSNNSGHSTPSPSASRPPSPETSNAAASLVSISMLDMLGSGTILSLLSIVFGALLI